jgi:hypothetical protein
MKDESKYDKAKLEAMAEVFDHFLNNVMIYFIPKGDLKKRQKKARKTIKKAIKAFRKGNADADQYIDADEYYKIYDR